jgi:hypothetical protein
LICCSAAAGSAISAAMNAMTKVRMVSSLRLSE